MTTQTDINLKPLDETAMLISLTMGNWNAFKFDRKITDKINYDYGANGDVSRVNKRIIAVEEIKKINKIVNKTRTYFYQQTLPWDATGWFVIPVNNLDKVTEKLRENRVKFEKTVNHFLSIYPDLKERAKMDLNGMYKKKDYPSIEKLEAKFHYSFDIKPIPSTDFRVSIQSSEVDKIRVQIENQKNQARIDISQDLWGRVHGVIEKMVERLDSVDKTFRDSLIWNVCEVAELLPSLNINNDKGLSDMADKIMEKLCVHEPEELRNNPITRQAVCNQAKGILKETDAIMDKMKGLF